MTMLSNNNRHLRLSRTPAKYSREYKTESQISQGSQQRVTLKILVTTRAIQTDIRISRGFLESNQCLAPLKISRISMTSAAGPVKSVHISVKNLKKRRYRKPLWSLKGKQIFLMSHRTLLSTRQSVNPTTHKTKNWMISRHQVGTSNQKKSPKRTKISNLNEQTVFPIIQNQS